MRNMRLEVIVIAALFCLARSLDDRSTEDYAETDYDDYYTDDDGMENETMSVEHESLLKLQSSLVGGASAILKNAMPYIVRGGIETNVSGRCASDIMSVIKAVEANEDWAFRLLDANGKPPSGILEGTLTDFGSFEECLESNNAASALGQRPLNGQYCLVDISADFDQSMAKNASAPANIKPDGVVWDRMLKLFWQNNDQLSFRYGLCVPSSCTAYDIDELTNYFLEPSGMIVEVANCQTEKPLEMDNVQIGVTTCLAFVIILSLVGTTVELITIQRNEEKACTSKKSVGNFFISFSLYRNTLKLLGSGDNRGSTLQHFDGLRSLSVLWIIVGHTYFYNDFFHYHHYRGFGRIRNIDDNLAFTPIANFTLAVDTFFIISGFLVVYSNWKKLNLSKGFLNLFNYIIHRIWRIWPAYLTIIGIVLLLPLIGSGPLWPEAVEDSANLCRSHWWKNIVFINNFQPPKELCLIHTWYLAVTMQFHLMAFALLFILYRFPKLCISTMIALTAMSAAGVYLYVQMYSLNSPTIIAEEVFGDHTDKILTLYLMPYNHFGAYLVGMITGYVLVKYKTIRVSTTVQCLGWLISAAVMLFVIFAPYRAYNGHMPTVTQSGIYLSLHRTAWAMGIAWIVFACSTNRAGILNKFLSWRFFRPMSTLSFLAYLIHPVLMLIHTGRSRERVYLGHYEFMTTFISRSVMSFALAFIIYIVVEEPFASIEKYIFPCSRPAKTPEKKSSKVNQSQISILFGSAGNHSLKPVWRTE